MILFWNLLMLTSCSTGARFSKVPVTFRTRKPVLCSPCLHSDTIKVKINKINNFENDTIKLVFSPKNGSTTCYLWRHISQPQQLTITELVSKCARGMNEQVLKTSRADVLSSRKKAQKNVGGIQPLSSPLYLRGSTGQLSYFGLNAIWRIQ